MKRSLLMALALLSFTLWLMPRAHAAGEACVPVDEVCDGKDNDCDRAIDDNIDCGPDLQCGCGHCNKIEENGSCATGTPWQGFCLEDHCPAGTACNMKTGQCRPSR